MSHLKRMICLACSLLVLNAGCSDDDAESSDSVVRTTGTAPGAATNTETQITDPTVIPAANTPSQPRPSPMPTAMSQSDDAQMDDGSGGVMTEGGLSAPSAGDVAAGGNVAGSEDGTNGGSVAAGNEEFEAGGVSVGGETSLGGLALTGAGAQGNGGLDSAGGGGSGGIIGGLLEASHVGGDDIGPAGQFGAEVAGNSATGGEPDGGGELFSGGSQPSGGTAGSSL